MPLNSKHLPKDVQAYLRELPYDDECKSEDTYQTKVNIYNEKCNGCGFALVLLSTMSEDGRQKIKKFEGKEAIKNANEFVLVNRCNIIRSCSYPLDMTYLNDDIEYPTLSEIVSNTCQFWNEDKLNIPSDEETSFTEIKDIHIKVEKWVDESRAEIFNAERVS